MAEHPGHCVALVGGAVSGAEAACQLAKRGIHVVLFEQNALPYGKIEDGLPKWHIKLRDKEERKIDEKLNNEYVHFAPCVKIGKDIEFRDLVNNWGFTVVLLATGAWRDRPLPIEGIDGYMGKGLCYQNPFFYWYNHKHEPDYKGPEIKIKDNAVIVGGGLASIDVAKAVMMELVEDALKKRGIATNMFELERKGIDVILADNGLTLDDIGVKGCTLYYRRRAKDMPLTSMKTDTADLLEKAQNTRVKILEKAMQKFLFRTVECSAPVDAVTNKGKLSGIVFQKTRIEDGSVIPIKGSEFKVETDLVISSIGSIPEQIPGIPVKGQIFDLEDEHTCQIRGYDNVFALGNAVTGR
ncbi:MAG: FAD-dependent oxidoreductase, partial [Flavobacteriales bacterium]